MKLQKINQKRAFQLVAEQLEDAIVSGRLKPGDKLPPERDMLVDLATSRRSLREAIRILEQKGLIETRLGVKGGSFVKVPTTDSVSESLALLIQFKKVPVKELAEFRLDLEGIVARRAAQRADESDIDHLKKIVSKAEAVLGDPLAEFSDYKEIDREYHLALAAAARNQLYASVLRIIHDNMSHYFEKHVAYHKGRFHDHYKEMIEMVEALKNQDGDKAFALASHHIQDFFRYVDAESQ
jgi:DNA-binding FadR family transcriptional regulator